MASSTVTLYHGDTENTVYNLAQTGQDKTVYRVADRPLAAPQTLTIERKIQPSGSKSNDKVSVTLLQTEINATTGALVTGYVKVDISIPRDTATMPGPDTVSVLLKEIGSLFGNNCGALTADSSASADKIIAGLDL